MKNILSNHFFLAMFTGVLLWIAWPANGFAPLLFVAFIPILRIENYFFENPQEKKRKLFCYSYLSFFTWNALTTWWVCNASLFGGIVANICNTLFMTITFQMFHFAHCKLKSKWSYTVLVFFWISFEYIHLNWDISWPWLTLGNGLAAYIKWIQWYEYTGILGGSCWMLAINILIFISAKEKLIAKKIVPAVTVLFIPIIISLFLFYTYTEKTNPVRCVVIQPNVDPYSEKFSSLSNEEQVIKILRLAYEKLNDSTGYLIAPETAIPYSLWEDQLEQYPEIKMLRKVIDNFPHLKIIIGASTNKAYINGEQPSETARKFKKQEGYYDSYNTALQIEKNKPILIYHKSKLVPGVEKMPYPQLFGFLENFAIDLGGTAGSLGTQDEPSVFASEEKSFAAPVICYESIYGEFLGKYVQRNANFISIITNDGWWGNTPGYRQHILYGGLRAVEMRRSIARSANTGISCFINQRGEISQATNWWEPAVIEGQINTNNEITFYARYGDFIGRFFLWLSAAVLLFASLLKFRPSN